MAGGVVLTGPGFRQFRPAVAQVHAPQPGHAVQDLMAVRLPDVDPLRPRDNACTPLTELPVIRERVQEMRAVFLLPSAELIRHAQFH